MTESDIGLRVDSKLKSEIFCDLFWSSQKLTKDSSYLFMRQLLLHFVIEKEPSQIKSDVKMQGIKTNND